MSKLQNRHDVEGMIGECRKILDDLEIGVLVEGDGEEFRTPSVYKMFELAASARRDGWPRSSMGGDGPSTTLDEEKMPMPPVSDTTGNAVVGPPVTDPIFKELRGIVMGVSDSLGKLRQSRARLVDGSQYADVQPGEPMCGSCERINEFAEVFRSGLCRWCYAFDQQHHRSPPITLVRAHHDGRKITRQMVADAFREEAEGKRPKKKKK